MAKDDPERARRLAEALRLNLRRRKQADAGTTAAETEADADGRVPLTPPGAPSPR